MRHYGKGVMTLLSALGLVGLLIVPAANAQETVEVRVDAYPETVSVRGEVVTVSVEVLVPPLDLPATITALSSDSYGDIADPANSAIVGTGCSVPVDYVQTGGWDGMGCFFEVLIEGEPGPVTDIISATIVLADATEVTVSDEVTVTISEQLGAIRGTLIDSSTGLPIPDVYVWGECLDCGGFTGPDGVFFFDGVEPGEYGLHSGSADPGGKHPTAPEGYLTEYAYEWYDEESVGLPGLPRTAITVLPGQITDIQWELSRGGAIDGIVTDSDTGEPLSDFRVAYWMIGPNGSASPSGVGGNGWLQTHHEDGSYRLSGLRGGDYIVCFETPYGNQCWDGVPVGPISGPPSGGVPVPVALGQTTSGIDAQFVTGGANGEGNGDGEGSGNGDGEGDGAVDGVVEVLPFTGVDSVVALLLGLGLLTAGGMVLGRYQRRPPASR